MQPPPFFAQYTRFIIDVLTPLTAQDHALYPERRFRVTFSG